MNWVFCRYVQYEALMPVDGTSGFDLYAFDTNRSVYLFIGNCLSAFLAAPTHGNASLVCNLGSASGAPATGNGKDHGNVHYILYLPLYNGVSQLSIGHSSVDGCVVQSGSPLSFFFLLPPSVKDFRS